VNVIDIRTMSERCYTVLKSLKEFDAQEVRGLVQTLLATTDRERCFIGIYYRGAANLESLLLLNHVRHVQGIAMLARAIFELAVDIKLLDLVPDAIQKISIFSDVEKLRAARKIVAFNASSKAQTNTVMQAFIANNEAVIEAQSRSMWPSVKSLRHWSGLNLSQRAARVKGTLHEMCELNYARLSWYVHAAGLTGFLGIDAKTFDLLAADQFQQSADCFCILLTAVIDEFGFEKANPKIKSQLTFAKMVPFADDAAGDLARELL
jgi:hypothetical protein